MSKRRSERIDVQIKVKINLGSESYDGFIYNVSQEGLYLDLITSSLQMVNNFTSQTRFKLKFQTETSKEIALHCEIKRVNTSPKSKVAIIYIIGAEIIDPSAEYREFLMTL
jgi:hypothetical protein